MLEQDAISSQLVEVWVADMPKTQRAAVKVSVEPISIITAKQTRAGMPMDVKMAVVSTTSRLAKPRAPAPLTLATVTVTVAGMMYKVAENAMITVAGSVTVDQEEIQSLKPHTVHLGGVAAQQVGRQPIHQKVHMMESGLIRSVPGKALRLLLNSTVSLAVATVTGTTRQEARLG